MPTKTLTADERRFVTRYVDAGATEDKIRDCERSARLKAGTGQKMLKKAHVQAEISLKMEPIRREQEFQRVVGAAVSAAMQRVQEMAAEQAAQLKLLTDLPLMDLDTKRIKHELMRLVVGLDQDKHPGVKLESIKAALVVDGILENGNIRRVTPNDPDKGDMTGGMYGDIFDRAHEAREQGATPFTPKLLEAEAEVHDLLPVSAPPLPPPGEEIENPAEIEDAKSIELKSRIRKLTTVPGFSVEIG